MIADDDRAGALCCAPRPFLAPGGSACARQRSACGCISWLASSGCRRFSSVFMGGRCRLQRSAHLPARPLPVLRCWHLVQPVPHGRAGATQLLRKPPCLCAPRGRLLSVRGGGLVGSYWRSVHGDCEKEGGGGGGGETQRCGAEARQRKQQAPAAEHCGRLRARMKPGPQLPPACGRPWSPTDSGTGMAETGGWGLVWTVCHGMVHVLLATYSCWLAAALGRLLHGCSRGVAAAGLDVGDRPRVALLVPAHVGVRQRSEMAGFAARHGFIAGCCCDWRWRGEDSCPRRFVQTGVDSRLGMR